MWVQWVGEGKRGGRRLAGWLAGWLSGQSWQCSGLSDHLKGTRKQFAAVLRTPSVPIHHMVLKLQPSTCFDAYIEALS